MAARNRLDGNRRHTATFVANQVFFTVYKIVVTLFIPLQQIAGVIPAVFKCGGVRLLIVEVTVK